MVSPQLLQQRLRRLPQLFAGAAEVHGEAWLEHVAQLATDYALLVTAELRERHHRGAARAAAKGGWKNGPAGHQIGPMRRVRGSHTRYARVDRDLRPREAGEELRPDA
eukprot:scaffold32268_cov58-Phaeocystis_antarctica.AAC.3